MKKYTQILFIICMSYSMYTMSADNIQPTACTQCAENKMVICTLNEIASLSEQLANKFENKYNEQAVIIQNQQQRIDALQNQINYLKTALRD